MDYSKKLLFSFLVISSFGASANTFQDELTRLLTNEGERGFSGRVLIANGATPYFSYSTLQKQKEAQFVIGSLSKQITAALVLREIEKGKLSLNQSIKAYVPSLPSEWGDEITIANLLNHTSGLVRPGKELAHSPGSSFRYSNWGYDLLAQATEEVTGQSYSQLVQSLFDSCSLNQSFAPSADRPSSQAENLVSGYFERELGKKELVTSAFPISSVPSGGVISSASDLVVWNQCLYLEGSVAEDIELLVNPTATRKHRWGDIGYGAGLQITATAAGVEYSHSGYIPGYISTMAYYPEYNVSLVILENVAWSPKDMKRVFGLHDQIRSLLIEGLSGNGLAPKLLGMTTDV